MPQLPNTDAAFRALIRSAVLTRRVMDPYFAGHGISGSQWGVLRALHRAEAEDAGGPGGVRMTDLGSRLLVRTPTVTGVVARLERAGLVLRAVAADDHRVRRLRLTAAGRRLVDRVLAGHAERIESMLAPLGQAERGTLAGLLGRVADHLESMADAAGHEAVGA
ncbi:MAG TPA: MarR family transcriptional regulator [Humisphaera sp.]